MTSITIIGAGVHGTRMAETYKSIKGVHLKAVVSPSRPVSPSWAETSHVNSASQWKDCYGKPSKADVFDVCVHPSALLTVLEEFAEIGAKNFILPKPVALTDKDLMTLLKIKKSYRLRIVVASQWHYATITKNIQSYVRKNKKKISRVEFNFSGRINGARGKKFTPPSTYLPHILQILVDSRLISDDSPPFINIRSESRINLSYNSLCEVNIETDLSLTDRKSTLEIYLSGEKRPSFIANFALVKNSNGRVKYPYIQVGKDKKNIQEDVLKKMSLSVVRSFSGQNISDVLSMEAYLPIAKMLVQINENSNKTIAVIGGGIFGTMSALKTAKKGVNVILFEKEPDIIMGASYVNQCRVHMGYHYPRDMRTARETLSAKKYFERHFSSSIRTLDNFYMIAKSGSKTSAAEYEQFCKEIGLPYQAVFPRRLEISPGMIEKSYKVPERIFDARSLRKEVLRQLSNEPRIMVRTLHQVTDIRRGADNFEVTSTTDAIGRKFQVSAVINATYAGLNQINRMAGVTTYPYQYELCEELVVSSPWKNTGWSIIDGPFFGAMPFGFAKEHLLYDVELSVLERSVGQFPEFKHDLAFHDTKKKRLTRFKAYQKKWSKFVPDVMKCKYIASIYTVRAVLPKVDKTDARPTLVNELAPGYWQIFSGKITTSIPQADEVADAIDLYLA